MEKISLSSTVVAALLFWNISHADARQIHAVASFSILADIVSHVGGEHVMVTSIVGPDEDSHVYEPKPQDAVALAKADIVIINGLGLESWLARMDQAPSTMAKTVTASAGVAARKMEEDGQQIADPHAWQSPANGLIYARNVADALCKVDSEDCDSFRKNVESYGKEIKVLDDNLHTRFGQIPEARRQVITTHDAFAYFGAAYGVRFLAAEGMSTESEPSAASLAKLVRQIKQSQSSALFLENMSDPRLIEQIANETGVRPGGTLFADALSKPGEGGANYLEMIKHNAELLIAAMAGS